MTRAVRPILLVWAGFFALTGASCDRPTGIDESGVKAVVITLDGMRPDALGPTNTPTIYEIAKAGAATLKAQTVAQSLTLPAHTSMMTGVTPERHGINYNDDTMAVREPVGVMTMFDLANAVGLKTAMFVGKSKLRPIVHNGAPTVVDMPAIGQVWQADTVAAHVVRYLATLNGQKKPSLMFIHLPDVDIAGHASGWMSTDYIAKVRHVDSTVAVLWTSLKAAYGSDLVLIITADHGGEGGGHSDGGPLARTTPFIIWGKGVTKQELTIPVSAMDVAPTMLWVVGINPPTDWNGVPLKAAFPTLTR